MEVAKKRSLKSYDKLLKKFKYAEALDAVLTVRTLIVKHTAYSPTHYSLTLPSHTHTHTHTPQGQFRPVVVVSLLNELVQREGLQIALSGRDDQALKPILEFASRNISNPRYTSLLISVAEVILG